jgi:hypothetical protein
LRSNLPEGKKVLTTTWAFKHKAYGTRQGCLNARGYEQLEGEHYYMADSVSSPVTNLATIRIIVLLLCMNPNWICKSVEDAFLQGLFENGEVIYFHTVHACSIIWDQAGEQMLLYQNL